MNGIQMMDAGTRNRSNVLLVEDDDVQREGLRAYLESGGHRVWSCASASEALVHVERSSADVAIVDLMLPDMDGLTLSERMREIDPVLGFIIVTMHPGVHSAVGAMRHGAADFIVKPVVRNQLLASVDQALARRAADHRCSVLENELQSLSRTNEDLNQFAGRVAHDLKSPVRAALLWVEFAREALQRGELEQADRFLASSFLSMESGSRVIDGLLALSKSRLRVLRAASLSVEPMVQLAIDSCRMEFRDSRHLVNAQVSGTLVADSVLVGIAVTNVIHNAFKYCSTQPKPRVDILAEPLATGEYRIAVQDNGVGVPADQMGRLFMPFERLTSALAFKGEGIGLTTVKQVMDRHGGQVTLTSSAQAGTTVELLFPARGPDGAVLARGPE